MYRRYNFLSCITNIYKIVTVNITNNSFENIWKPAKWRQNCAPFINYSAPPVTRWLCIGVRYFLFSLCCRNVCSRRSCGPRRTESCFKQICNNKCWVVVRTSISQNVQGMLWILLRIFNLVCTQNWCLEKKMGEINGLQNWTDIVEISILSINPVQQARSRWKICTKIRRFNVKNPDHVKQMHVLFFLFLRFIHTYIYIHTGICTTRFWKCRQIFCKILPHKFFKIFIKL